MSEPWTFQFPTAELGCGRFSGSIDVSAPSQGVSRLRLGEGSLDGSLLATRWTGEPAAASGDKVWPFPVGEAYVRGNDLVASYQSTPGGPFAPQIYWSAESAGLAMLISVQTDLLDTHPRADVGSRLPAEEVLAITTDADGTPHVQTLDALAEEQTLALPRGMACILCRLPGGEQSYAEMAPAADVRHLAVRHAAGGMCETRWELFADFLEKGVIRRARMQSVFLPRSGDEERTVALCQAFAARELPLTA